VLVIWNGFADYIRNSFIFLIFFSKKTQYLYAHPSGTYDEPPVNLGGFKGWQVDLPPYAKINTVCWTKEISFLLSPLIWPLALYIGSGSRFYEEEPVILPDQIHQ